MRPGASRCGGAPVPVPPSGGTPGNISATKHACGSPRAPCRIAGRIPALDHGGLPCSATWVDHGEEPRPPSGLAEPGDQARGELGPSEEVVGVGLGERPEALVRVADVFRSDGRNRPCRRMRVRRR